MKQRLRQGYRRFIEQGIGNPYEESFFDLLWSLTDNLERSLRELVPSVPKYQIFIPLIKPYLEGELSENSLKAQFNLYKLPIKIPPEKGKIQVEGINLNISLYLPLSLESLTISERKAIYRGETIYLSTKITLMSGETYHQENTLSFLEAAKHRITLPLKRKIPLKDIYTMVIELYLDNNILKPHLGENLPKLLPLGTAGINLILSDLDSSDLYYMLRSSLKPEHQLNKEIITVSSIDK